MRQLIRVLAVLAVGLMAAPALAGWPIDDGVSHGPWQITGGGVTYTEVQAGTGQAAVNGARVVVHYTGYLEDGSVFDSSVDRGQTFDFRIGDHAVIRGWEDGVVGMKIGGKRRLIIPPALGYGDRAAGMIPPGSTLYFEIELFEVHAPRHPPEQPRPVDPALFRATKTGLQYVDLIVGHGDKPKPGERVCVDFAAWVDGKRVEHTYDKERCWWFRYKNSDVIDGMVEGLAKMREGGVRQLRVPPALGYGAVGSESIPAGATVLYEIELIEVD